MTDRATSAPQQGLRAVRAAVTITAATIVLAACAAATSSPSADQEHESSVKAETGAAVASSSLPAGAGRVQVLAVARHGEVLAATDRGLFTVSRTGSSRVGTLTADLDGLAVSADEIYVSSHPAPGGQGPQRASLLRSRDEGKTWTEVAASDPAHLDALAVRGDTIVGWDRGRLWVSTDGGQAWRSTVTATEPVSLTLDRTALWLTGRNGLERARQDGSALVHVTDAPALVRGGLGADRAVWGMDQVGDVWLRDSHEQWRQAASLASGSTVTAFTAIDARHAVVATGHQLVWITVNDVAALPRITYT